MYTELIVIAVAGFAAAGAIRALGLVVRDGLPRWLLPAAVALAMAAAAISADYLWFARTTSALPEGMAVASHTAVASPLRPWSYVVPVTNRFVAVDTAALEKNEEAGTYTARIYLFAHWRPIQAVRMLVDCAGSRRAELPTGDAAPQWRDVGPEGPIVKTVCSGG